MCNVRYLLTTYFYALLGSIRCSWDSDQVLLLITLYEKFRELYDSGKLTTRQFYKKIVVCMEEKGYKYNITQCTDKMENLKKKYKETYDHNAKSGNDRKTFEFYDVISISILYLCFL